MIGSTLGIIPTFFLVFVICGPVVDRRRLYRVAPPAGGIFVASLYHPALEKG